MKSHSDLSKKISKEQVLTAITNAMIKNQKKGEPVHKWGFAKVEDMEMWQPSQLVVEEFMTTDLFTVQKDDILELVANLFEWRRIRYVPVEDDNKHLVGLITMRTVFKEFNKEIHQDEKAPKIVSDLMIKNPITIHPEASILEAIDIMDSQRIGCLPVVKNNRLVGIITEQNYMTITARLLRRLHQDNNQGA
jgi:predicted transcriptional regulator